MRSSILRSSILWFAFSFMLFAPECLRSQCANCDNGTLSCSFDYECQDWCGPSYVCDSSFFVCTYQPPSPIIIDVDGNGYAMTSAEDGVVFDFYGAGHPIKVSWTARGSDDAWLALDINGNGSIENAGELFGNWTLLPRSKRRASDGFEALGAYDAVENGGNSDGVIDAADRIYSKLLLWRDGNHNGVSESDELFSLPAMQITSVDLNYHLVRFVDQYGNAFRYRSRLRSAKDTTVGRFAYDVFLVKAP